MHHNDDLKDRIKSRLDLNEIRRAYPGLGIPGKNSLNANCPFCEPDKCGVVPRGGGGSFKYYQGGSGYRSGYACFKCDESGADYLGMVALQERLDLRS